MRALTAIVTLTFLSIATPGAVTTVAAAERACGTEAAAYLAAADPATARSDLLFCLLGNAAVHTDIVKFGEEGAFYYKAYPSTRRVTSGRNVVGTGTSDFDIGPRRSWVVEDCVAKQQVTLIDTGGSLKLETDLFAIRAQTLTELLADKENARDLLASTLESPLAFDLTGTNWKGWTSSLTAYKWANSIEGAANETKSENCPPWAGGLIWTGGQTWSVGNPYLQSIERFGKFEIMEIAE